MDSRRMTRWRRPPVQVYRRPSGAVLDLRVPPMVPGQRCDGDWVIIGVPRGGTDADRFVLASFDKRGRALEAMERYRRAGIEATLTVERAECRR